MEQVWAAATSLTLVVRAEDAAEILLVLPKARDIAEWYG